MSKTRGTPWRALALAVAAALCAAAAPAAVVTLTPASAATAPGGAITVDVRISELGTGNALGAFDLDLAFTPGLLSFTGATFGSGLGNPLLLETITSAAVTSPGVLDLSAVSFLTPAQLAAAQSASFSLATLTFTGTAAGSATFGLLATSSLSDAFGRALPIGTAPPIPEPETLGLLSLGLAALALKRRTFRKTPARLA